MVRKRDVEGAVPYAKLYVCRGDHRSPNEKQIIDKRELRKEPPHRRLRRQLPSMGAIRKPLLEERCHEVTEWWQIKNKFVEATIGRLDFMGTLNILLTKSLIKCILNKNTYGDII